MLTNAFEDEDDAKDESDNVCFCLRANGPLLAHVVFRMELAFLTKMTRTARSPNKTQVLRLLQMTKRTPMCLKKLRRSRCQGDGTHMALALWAQRIVFDTISYFIVEYVANNKHNPLEQIV